VSCEATADHLEVVHETLTRFWQELESPPGDEWRMLFELAVSEIAANIVEHARPQRMTLRLSLDGTRVVAEFEDSGQGWSGPPEPGRVIDELAERGRGLQLAMKAVDDVVYERDGSTNRWRLRKSM
jgi:serine/threonine-protein kinase RsbW